MAWSFSKGLSTGGCRSFLVMTPWLQIKFRWLAFLSETDSVLLILFKISYVYELLNRISNTEIYMYIYVYIQLSILFYICRKSINAAMTQSTMKCASEILIQNIWGKLSCQYGTLMYVIWCMSHFIGNMSAHGFDTVHGQVVLMIYFYQGKCHAIHLHSVEFAADIKGPVHIGSVSCSMGPRTCWTPCHASLLSWKGSMDISDVKILYITELVFAIILHPFRAMILWSLQSSTWWCHQMETFSALLTLCAGNTPLTGEFPEQRPGMRSFDCFFDLHLNKQLSKQS